LRWAECEDTEAEMIDEADVEVALALLGYFMAQAERVHRQLPVTLNDEEEGTVLRWARKQAREDLKVRELHRSNCLARRGVSTADDYRAVLRRLADRDLVVVVDKDTFRLTS